MRIPRADRRCIYSLREAVRWIALNDSDGDDDPVEQLSGYVSVAFVADAWGVDQTVVAQMVYDERHPKGGDDDAARRQG